MTIFHVLVMCGLVFGALLGYRVGVHAGVVIGGITGVFGALLGVILARIPLLLTLRWIKRAFQSKSSKELRAMLGNPLALGPNAILLELRSRGEDISQDLPTVMQMLVSPSQLRRRQGWYALASAFPELARQSKDYRDGDTPQECAEKIKRVSGQVSAPGNGRSTSAEGLSTSDQ